jgi:hypothetical protein
MDIIKKGLRAPIKDNNKPTIVTTSNNFFCNETNDKQKGRCFPTFPGLSKPLFKKQ